MNEQIERGKPLIKEPVKQIPPESPKKPLLPDNRPLSPGREILTD